MFSGIIKTIAAVKKVQRQADSMTLTISTPRGWKIKPGDSIATDGACLTVAKVIKGEYQCKLMPETLSKTTFGIVAPEKVNLESSLKLSSTIDGHLVTGHIDAVGKIMNVISHDDSRVYEIQLPREFRNLIAPKGSIAIDGISLTVVGVSRDSFTVSLVEYTLTHTTLGGKGSGDLVNLEFDILAKYVAAQTNR
jgi:riboflavin synthase alpha subunit